MQTPKFVLGMSQICDASEQKPPLVYEAIKRGDLETFLIGRRRFAKPDAVQRWVDFLQAESDAGRPVCYQARDKTQAAA